MYNTCVSKLLILLLAAVNQTVQQQAGHIRLWTTMGTDPHVARLCPGVLLFFKGVGESGSFLPGHSKALSVSSLSLQEGQ